MCGYRGGKRNKEGEVKVSILIRIFSVLEHWINVFPKSEAFHFWSPSRNDGTSHVHFEMILLFGEMQSYPPPYEMKDLILLW